MLTEIIEKAVKGHNNVIKNQFSRSCPVFCFEYFPALKKAEMLFLICSYNLCN